MTDWTMESTERDLSGILGRYLRARTTCAKDLARRIDCEPRTAEGFRAGRHWPQAKHWPRLIGAFGRDIIDCVFFPDEALARLTEEEAALEAKLRETRAQIGAVAEGGRRPPSRAAGVRTAAEARSFEPAD